jgi:hypothetical protein
MDSKPAPSLTDLDAAAASSWFKDALVPLVALVGGAVVLAATGLGLPAWALMGALAGYSLSGSV